ncbi:MAG: hypothetical protein WED09_07210 [Homoserinimonas sp.]
MAGRICCDFGGIASLDEFLTGEHGEAIEYDLLAHGFRLRDLGTESLTWRDLAVLVRRWERVPATAFSESVHGTSWSIGEQLLAMVVDALHMGNWQRMGKKSAPKPKRIPRPWEKSKSQSLGKDPIPVSAFKDWWESKARKRRRPKK